MKAYILSIAGIILLSAVISIVSPPGKMGKFLKGATKLFILLVLVSPFVSWFTDGEFSLMNVSDVFEADTEYYRKCADLLSAADREAIELYISEEYGLESEAEVARRADENFTCEKIVIKISDFGIFGQDERIDIVDSIRETIEKKYGCSAEVS